ncbi:MAG: F0F1 ATP synthase subunit epsilon [Alphaproteobacteria bacterium]|jgi:F0F1-type ATP synthase epsilon subunit|nr:F0F1 ATP synthase subunit epsilon [Alphaproteobacteria bacterium]
MSDLKLKIVSNHGTLLEQNVEMVVLPGYFGDIGITAGERVFVYLLKAGIIYVFNSSGVSARYFVFGGRFKLENDELVVATEQQLIDLSKIDKEDINNKIQTFEELKTKTDNKTLLENYEHTISAYKEALLSENTRLYK